MNRQQNHSKTTELHYLDEKGNFVRLEEKMNENHIEYEEILTRNRKKPSNEIVLYDNSTHLLSPETEDVDFQEIKEGINIDSFLILKIILFSGLVFLVYSFLKFIVISLLIIVLFFLMFQMSRIPAPRRSSLTRQNDFVKRQNVNVNNNIRSSGANVNVTTNVNVT